MYFVIPSSSGLVATNTQVRVDKGAERDTQTRLKKANFGDGYKARIPDGINILEEKFAVTFSPREKAEIDDIADYFALLGGVTAITLFVPNTHGQETIKVTCESWRKQYIRDEIYALQAQFERTYEP